MKREKRGGERGRGEKRREERRGRGKGRGRGEKKGRKAIDMKRQVEGGAMQVCNKIVRFYGMVHAQKQDRNYMM